MSTTIDNLPPAHLAEKYKHIPFVYLDVPKIIPDDNFIEMWLESKQVVKRLQISDAFPYTPEEAEKIKAERGPSWQNEWADEDANFHGISLIRDGMANDPKFQRWSRLIIDGYKNFPKLMEQIHTYFPIKKLHQMHCWSNQRRLGLHRDGFDQIPGIPTSLRIMLLDNNPGPTFWMQPIPEDKLGWGWEHTVRDESQIKTLDLSKTPETNSFCFNNYNFLHAAEKDQEYWKILGMFTLDWEWTGFEKLIDKSVEKYGNQ